ncbi:MAG: hypothetical protein KDC71_23080 [Acidobacteria bacterium]|nr:hypothetical protein [Acidobacteriota bacterium]
MAIPKTEPLHPIQVEIYKKMTAEEKVAIMEQLFRDAFELKRGYIQIQHPDWSAEEVHRATARAMMLAGE